MKNICILISIIITALHNNIISANQASTNYNLWKNDVASEWQNQNILEPDDKHSWLINRITRNLYKLKRVPSCAVKTNDTVAFRFPDGLSSLTTVGTESLDLATLQCLFHSTQALYAYNFLRELTLATTVETLDQVEREWPAESYRLWKQKKIAALEATGDRSDQMYSLMENTRHYLAALDRPNKNKNLTQALYSYNLLREFYGLSTIDTINDIDRHWFDAEDYRMWKDREIAFLQERMSRSQQIGVWLQSIQSHLAALDKPNHSHHDSYQRSALYLYNLLRECYELPTINTINDIDRHWLVAEDYRTWKDQKIAVFEANRYTLPEQISHLLAMIRFELQQVEKDPSESSYQREALYYYNFLAQLSGKFSAATSVDAINPDNLKENVLITPNYDLVV